MTHPLPQVAWDRRTLLALLALTVFAALLRFPGLGAEDLWFDEVFSVVLASQDLGELLRRAIADETNPPGFYLLLSGWLRLGSVDEEWLRALPALAGTLTVPAVVLLGKEIGLPRGAALLGGLLAAVSPLLLAMSLEVRAYAPVALLSAMSLTLAVRLASPARDDAPALRLALGVVDLGLVMLHYFGALVVFARVVGAFAATRGSASAGRARRDALLTALPAALLLALWFAVVISASTGVRVGENAAWIPTAGLAGVPAFASLVIGSLGTQLGAVAVPLLLLASLFVAGRSALLNGGSWWLLIAAVLPLLIVLSAGAVTGRSLWVGRYLIIALPPLLLLAAAMPWSLSVRARTPAAVALAAWACLAGPYAERTRQAKPAWSTIVPSLVAAGPTTVCVNEPFVGLPLQYHAIRGSVPLTVREIARCLSERTVGWVMIRPGTERSLGMLSAAGALLGPPRALGTELPPVVLQRLEWPVRRAAP